MIIRYLLHERSKCILWQAIANRCHFSDNLQKMLQFTPIIILSLSNTTNSTSLNTAYQEKNLNCSNHFVAPRVHGFFPFRKTFRHNRFRIQFLQGIKNDCCDVSGQEHHNYKILLAHTMKCNLKAGICWPWTHSPHVSPLRVRSHRCSWLKLLWHHSNFLLHFLIDQTAGNLHSFRSYTNLSQPMH